MKRKMESLNVDEKHPIAHLSMVVLAWLGSIQLAQVQTFIAIVSGLLVAVYTGLRIIYLLKEKKDAE